MKPYLGIDYGTARIGLALSNPSHTLALPLSYVQAGKTHEESCQKILTVIKEKLPLEGIVIGLPLLLNGKESAMSQEVRAFASTLETLCDIEITLLDERMSSLQAERVLKERKLKRKKRTEFVDSLSATLILQSFLDAKKNLS